MNRQFLWGTVIIIILYLLFGKVFKKDVWRGFYYPQGSFAGPYVYSPEYGTKEDCISWAENEWKSRPEDKELSPQNLYECGRNCKLDDPNNPESLYICEVTFDGGDWRRGDYGQ